MLNMATKHRKPINEILAASIADAMRRRHIRTQEELAKLSGLSQRTISNYLNPTRRTKGTSGKAPSAKLSEVEKIAQALDVEAWNLLRELSPREREFYASIESAYRRMRAENGDDDAPA
jgi:transcriptional regulator with XRE-family HTH domain